MRGSKAKKLRQALAPNEKLKTLGDTRVSRGQFMRATTQGDWAKVPKSRGIFKSRVRWIRDEDGEVVRATHSLQYRLKQSPRLAYKIVKRRMKNG